MTDTVGLPTYYELVGFGALLGGFAGALPTRVGAPVAMGFGVACLLLGRWLQ